MKELEERILNEGRILEGGILKVDSFLNHQIDPDLISRIGVEFARRFEADNVTKILTIEASGIPAAVATAMALHVPCIYAKKVGAKNVSGDVYLSSVHSYTYDKDYTILVSRPYLSCTDRVLIIDDFLACGAAANGLADIVSQAGSYLCGIGICIEKGFQDGGKDLRERGIKVESLAIVKSIDGDKITLEENN